MTQEKVHDFRKLIDANIQIAERDLSSDESDRPDYKREMALVRTKLQEAKMWAGKILEVMGAPFPKELADKAETNDAH